MPQRKTKHDALGVLPDFQINELLQARAINCEIPLVDGQIQPASLDLRLGKRAWRVRASFLPKAAGTVEERLSQFAMQELDLSHDTALETGCIYIVEIEEQLALPSNISGYANPKSSTGRLDIFTRILSNSNDSYDMVAPGYQGKLYIEVCPKTFPILLRAGSRLCQLRFSRQRDAGAASLPDAAIPSIGEAPDQLGFKRNFADSTTQSLRVDLSSSLFETSATHSNYGELIGWRAKRFSGLIDVDRVESYEVNHFWEPVHSDNRRIILDPGEFYILASKEYLKIKPQYAAEMIPFNPSIGEFRVHYAGFFDPGFGVGSIVTKSGKTRASKGSRAVLEVRCRDTPFVLEHEQVIGHLRYDKMAALPDKLYGSGISSNYQGQGLKLSKHFKRPTT